MAKMTIDVWCPKCQQKIEAQYVGTYGELLKKVLQRAGIQPGDTLFKDVMEKVNFPGE